VIDLPCEFPFLQARIFSRNSDFTFRAHVTIASREIECFQLCLYASPEHQWRPELGISGLLFDLATWLERAAKGDLDQAGMPVHPPVTNVALHQGTFFVAQDNTPHFNGSWFGYAVINPINKDRFDIVGWQDTIGGQSDKTLAPAVLVDKPFASEYPPTIALFIYFLQCLDIEISQVADVLLGHAFRCPRREPIYFVFGTAMRGTVGSGVRQQHLAVAKIEVVVANKFRKLAKKGLPRTNARADNICAKGAYLLQQWADAGGTLSWCRVYEARPEVVVRRDSQSSVQWFHGKSVTLWGCGAIGSVVAEMLVRAGVRAITLVDLGAVTPGVLVRQNYRDEDIGLPKVDALATRLIKVSPQVTVVRHCVDLLADPNAMAETAIGADVLIDATASRLVALKLEKTRVASTISKMPNISFGIDQAGRRSLLTMSRAEHSAGPYDILRKVGIRVSEMANQEEVLEAFFPSTEPEWFEPEPGCSAPTFAASAADVASLAGGMVSVAAELLSSEDEKDYAYVSRVAMVNEAGTPVVLPFEVDLTHICPVSGFEIRMCREAARSIKETVKRSAEQFGTLFETGGVLYGERNEALRIVWVDEATGPPTDSRSSPTEFVCGVAGVADRHDELQRGATGRRGFIGSWHTHPGGSCQPSHVDEMAMRSLVSGPDCASRKALLVVVVPKSDSVALAVRMFE
jgi:Dinucleotide-utilizing enzymes involved in molybdopterin and thiamine biosynthesis family 2